LFKKNRSDSLHLVSVMIQKNTLNDKYTMTCLCGWNKYVEVCTI